MKAWRATSWPSAMRWRLTWLAGLFPAVRWRGYDDPAAREEVGGPGACECTEFTCRVNGPYGKQCSLSRSSFRSSALQHEKETVAPPNQAGVQLGAGLAVVTRRRFHMPPYNPPRHQGCSTSDLGEPA